MFHDSTNKQQYLKHLVDTMLYVNFHLIQSMLLVKRATASFLMDLFKCFSVCELLHVSSLHRPMKTRIDIPNGHLCDSLYFDLYMFYMLCHELVMFLASYCWSCFLQISVLAGSVGIWSWRLVLFGSPFVAATASPFLRRKHPNE